MVFIPGVPIEGGPGLPRDPVLAALSCGLACKLGWKLLRYIFLFPFLFFVCLSVLINMQQSSEGCSMAHNTTACAEKKLWGLTQNKPMCVYVCVCKKIDECPGTFNSR